MQFMIFNHPTNSHSKLHTSIMDLPAYAGYDYGDFFHYSSFFYWNKYINLENLAAVYETKTIQQAENNQQTKTNT